MSFIYFKYQNWDIYHQYNISWSWKSCFTLILNLPALSGLYKVWKKRKPKSLSQNFAFGSLIDSGNNTPVKKTWETFQQYVHSVYYTNRKLGIFIDLVPTSTAPSKGRTISWVLMKVWQSECKMRAARIQGFSVDLILILENLEKNDGMCVVSESLVKTASKTNKWSTPIPSESSYDCCFGRRRALWDIVNRRSATQRAAIGGSLGSLLWPTMLYDHNNGDHHRHHDADHHHCYHFDHRSSLLP